MSAALQRLIDIVGRAHAITEPREQARFLCEWRDLYVGRAALVVLPGSTREVSEILAAANEAGIGIVPQLSGTPNGLLTKVALGGFVLNVLGTFFGHLFAADQSELIKTSQVTQEPVPVKPENPIL